VPAFDSWIVGDSPDSGRTYVVHAVAPRFILEVVELQNDEWKVGALVWLDDPGPEEAAHWSSEAGDVFFRSIQVAHDAS